MKKILVFDIGGTNIRFAVATGNRLGRPILRPVPKNNDQALKTIAGVARENKAGMIVGGLPGPLDAHHSKLLQSTHLPTWATRPFQRDLARNSGAKVLLENDSALVALGEATHGSGRGARIVAYIGFGTGIGGARIVDGTIDANAKGFEPGHHIIDWNVSHHRHPSPHPGDWESFLSGSATYVQTGVRSQSIRDRRYWKKMDERAAIGLINVSMFWSPDVIVLGGSLMKRLSIAEIRRVFRQRQHIFPQPPKIRRAALGDFAGLYGALSLSQQSRHFPNRR